MVPRIERGISTFEATSLLGKQLSKNLLRSLIVVLVLWAVAATIGHFIPEKDVLVAFEVRQTKDGPDRGVFKRSSAMCLNASLLRPPLSGAFWR